MICSMEKININKIQWNNQILESDDVDLDSYIITGSKDDEINEKLSHYLDFNYTIKLDKIIDESGQYWLAEHPDLPGCKTHGNTKEDALNLLEDAKKTWIYSKLHANEAIPTPNSEPFEECSGKFLLRLPKELHYKIIKSAEANNTSINQYLVYLITESLIQKSLDVTGIMESIYEIKSIMLRKNIENNTGLMYEMFSRRLGTHLFSEQNSMDYNKSSKNKNTNVSITETNLFKDFSAHLQ